MAKQVYQIEAVKPGTVLTTGTSVQGDYIDIGAAESNFSLILEDSGASGASLTVIYTIGYKVSGKDTVSTLTKDDNLQEITPDDGGTISDFTTIDLSSNVRKHTVVTLAVARWYRFKITNNDGANSSTVSLKVIFQK